MPNPIYLDYAAATPVDGDAIIAARRYATKIFYNPSSAHFLGQKASFAVERAREQCARAIGADNSEIYFTCGGTEAINWAMRCVLSQGTRIAVSAIEHDAVIANAELLSSGGGFVDYIKPNVLGTVTAEALEKSIGTDTSLVCVMAVNNITGAIQPIKELCQAAHKHGALFFTDAVQAINGIKIDVKDWDVDLLAVSGHKFYAPKGVGFLYVKKGVKITPLLYGGEQEHNLRAGTIDVPSVVAMGVAIEKAQANVAKYNEYTAAVVDAFESNLAYGETVRCEKKTADIISRVFYFPNKSIDGGRLAVALSCAGVCCSVGSACSAGSAVPPRTLTEMGVAHPECSVRFSFGKTTTVFQAERAAKIVNRTVRKLIG